MASNVITPIEIQTLDSATIGAGVYTPFNVAGIEGALSFIRITNASNTPVYISFDGVEDNHYVGSGKVLPVYFQVNSSPTNEKSKLKKRTIVYARGAAGQGDLYAAGYYNE